LQSVDFVSVEPVIDLVLLSRVSTLSFTCVDLVVFSMWLW